MGQVLRLHLLLVGGQSGGGWRGDREGSLRAVGREVDGFGRGRRMSGLGRGRGLDGLRGGRRREIGLG